MHITAPDFASAYNSILRGLQDNGEEAAPRGKRVLELREPALWTIKNSQAWIPNMKHRRLNIFFALAEVVWMWSGNGSVEFIRYYNESITQFSDPGVPYFNAAYGKRVRHYGYEEDFQARPWAPWVTRHIQGPDGSYGLYAGQETVEIDQLQAVIKKLNEDQHTRQAVICLWDPIKDNLIEGSKDYPCNNLVYCQIREDVLRKPILNLTVVMRSNDIILGTPYNMIQFSHLHALLAGALGVEMGIYNVVVNNLHMYADDYYPESVRKLIPKWRNGVYGDARLLLDTKPTWNMVWSLHQFDEFVANIWYPIEEELRQLVGAGTLGEADMLDYIERFGHTCEDMGVPTYWRQVFMMLFVWHARKAKFQHYQEWTASILESVNPMFRVLALDFDPQLG